MLQQDFKKHSVCFLILALVVNWLGSFHLGVTVASPVEKRTTERSVSKNSTTKRSTKKVLNPKKVAKSKKAIKNTARLERALERRTLASKRAAKGLSDKQKTFIDTHIEWAIILGDETERIHGSKPPITSVIAQSAYESGWGESNFCLLYNNDFGIGGARAPRSFETHFESWAYYYALVATREGYVENGSLKMANTYDYINALVAGGYCSDEGYLQNALDIANKIKPYVIAKEAEVRLARELQDSQC